MNNSKIKFIVSLSMVFFIAISLISCGNNENKKEQVKTITHTQIAKVLDPLEKQILAGKKVYKQTCFACHQANGEGIPNAFPPLAKSDYLNADINRAIDIVLKGKTGEITVNGSKYNSPMIAQAINSKQIADVLTYVYNSWDNNGTVITTAQVEKLKTNNN